MVQSQIKTFEELDEEIDCSCNDKDYCIHQVNDFQIKQISSIIDLINFQLDSLNDNYSEDPIDYLLGKIDALENLKSILKEVIGCTVLKKKMTTKKQFITEKIEEELKTIKEEILAEAFELVANNLKEYSTNMSNKEFVETILKISNKYSIEQSFNKGVEFGKQEQKKEELKFLRKAEDLGFFDRDCLCDICVFVKERIKQLEGVKHG